MGTMINVENLSKTFKIQRRSTGFTGAVKYIFHPTYEYKKAVNDVSFSIGEGEMVGFIGPNGAGKSTTVKMLSGILYPDSGSITVAGYIPHKQRKEYVANIGVVFGQKSQISWDLSPLDSYEVIKHIYRIPDKLYKDNLERYAELLDMSDYIDRPVRQLSLGQRMRADIAAALLHSPKIVFFDEPTIGIDVVGKDKIRKNVKTGCVSTRIIEAEIEDMPSDIYIEHTQITHYDSTGKLTVMFDTDKISTSEVMSQLMKTRSVKDISIKEPGIDAVIRDIYEGRIKVGTATRPQADTQS